MVVALLFEKKNWLFCLFNWKIQSIWLKLILLHHNGSKSFQFTAVVVVVYDGINSEYSIHN